jgi:hypothetical protein
MLRYPAIGAIWAVLTVLGVPASTGIAGAQQPSAPAIAAAKQLIAAKGANAMYGPLVIGIVEKAKGVFLQANPMLGKDLNEVAAKLRADFAPRAEELINETARLYATRFTEQELKDALAFYRSPLGRKLLDQEPGIADQSMKSAASWADKLSEEVINRMRAEMRKRGHEI